MVIKMFPMADDEARRPGERMARINLGQQREVAFWTRELGISEHRLHEFVAKLGDSVDDVRRALGLTREPPHISRSRWGYQR
jgi:Protein of unknown function (DUF3606)